MSTHWTGLWIGLLEFRCYEVRIEESEKGQQPPGVKPRTPLAWATSALPLNYGNQTTTNPQNPLYILHRWYWMPQSHTWQPLSMCHQNSIRCRLESSLYQERTMLSGFSHSKCSEHLTSCWKEMSFQQAICYLSLRWVNILYAWTVNSVNRLVKNPKHITTITFTPSLTFTHLQVVRNAYSSASRMPDYLLVIEMGEGYAWLKRWVLQCVLDS